MNVQQKVKEIEKTRKNLKAEMPRVLKEVEVYEKALRQDKLSPKTLRVSYNYIEKT